MTAQTPELTLDRNAELDRPSLIHKSWMIKDGQFMAEIDATGGWPVGFLYVSFYHAVEDKGRVCKFTNVELRTGWWTTVLSADDYYWWKLSESKKKEIFKEARQQLISQLR